MAINARGAHVHGDFNLNRSLNAEGRINLADAVITGHLNFGNQTSTTPPMTVAASRSTFRGPR